MTQDLVVGMLEVDFQGHERSPFHSDEQTVCSMAPWGKGQNQDRRFRLLPLKNSLRSQRHDPEVVPLHEEEDYCRNPCRLETDLFLIVSNVVLGFYGIWWEGFGHCPEFASFL